MTAHGITGDTGQHWKGVIVRVVHRVVNGLTQESTTIVDTDSTVECSMTVPHRVWVRWRREAAVPDPAR